jgi:hypothetical protein
LNEEKHKYRCAVRQLIKWRRDWGLKEFRDYMYQHKNKLGLKLVRDFEDQWNKGNRATEKGEWK